MKRIKWENIIFIILVGCYIYNAFSIEKNAIQTIIVQAAITYIFRLVIKYIRVNWEQTKEVIIELFA